MTVLVGFAFISGVVTILSPCILPVLPVVLASGSGGGRARPIGVVAGFAASFTVFTLALAALVDLLGIPADLLRWVAVALIAAFGLTMLVPRLRAGLELLGGRLALTERPSSRPPGAATSGFAGGLVVGAGLGLVWTPCVGPIMASVIGLAVTRRLDGGAVLIAASYALGTSIPLLAAMLGGKALLRRVAALARNAARIERALGAVTLLVAAVIALGWDRRFQATVLEAFPGYGAGLTAIEETPAVARALEARERDRSPDPALAAAEQAGGDRLFAGAPADPAAGAVLGDWGRAPEIVTAGPWLNTEGAAPLTMEGLRGKVVVVDFWTYSCVNCLRTLPYLRSWWEAYRDDGLVILGVHAPEFAFERAPANVARAVRELGVSWPVVLDNEFAQWEAYRNRYWPAKYLVDAAGRVRAFHFGEGSYEAVERQLRELLREAGADVGGRTVSGREPPLEPRTPETYLGYERARGLVTDERPAPGVAIDLTPPRPPGPGEWTLSGRWIVSGEYVVPESTGVLELRFEARDVYLVIEPEQSGGTIDVAVDGAVPPDTEDVRSGRLAADESRLYHLARLGRGGARLLRLDVRGRLRLFAFTFG